MAQISGSAAEDRDPCSNNTHISIKNGRNGDWNITGNTLYSIAENNAHDACMPTRTQEN